MLSRLGDSFSLKRFWTIVEVATLHKRSMFASDGGGIVVSKIASDPTLCGIRIRYESLSAVNSFSNYQNCSPSNMLSVPYAIVLGTVEETTTSDAYSARAHPRKTFVVGCVLVPRRCLVRLSLHRCLHQRSRVRLPLVVFSRRVEAFLFDDSRGKRHSWALVDVGVEVAMGGLSGIVPSTISSCAAWKGAIVEVACGDVVLPLVLVPLRAMCECLTMATLTAPIGVLGAVDAGDSAVEVIAAMGADFSGICSLRTATAVS